MMNRSVLELFLMGAFNRSKAKQTEVEAKVRADRCLLDGVLVDGVPVPCDRKPRSRGVCNHHREAFYTERDHLETLELRAKFEAEQVREGLILLPNELVKIKRKARSVFKSVG
jgi:hypothetical protein